MARLPAPSGTLYYRPHDPSRRLAAVTTPAGADPHDPFRDTLADALAPSYVLGRELMGGMSRVFVADEPALGRTVVVKVLPTDWAPGMNRDRFLREIQVAARLQHPHIVPLLAAGEVAGSLYYTMPFIEGESLRDALARERRFTVREVVRLLHDVVDALAHAHARGVIHRDVKPANVLLLGSHALVTDFGVAKALSEARQAPGGGFTPGTTSTGLAIGTPAYMAPEQLAADPAADHRIDLYAAGLLGYELLAGVSPFTADSPQGMLAAQLTRVPPSLHTIRPDVPEPLSALIDRALAKDPAGRPPTAAAMLAELDAAVVSLLSTATPPETPGVTLGASGLGGRTSGAHAGATVGMVAGAAAGIGGANAVTAPFAAPIDRAAHATTTAAIASAAGPPRRHLSGLLGGALLGMGIVLVGGWAVVRGFGPRAGADSTAGAASAATAGAATAATAAVGTPLAPVAPTLAARALPTMLTRDDSLAIAAAVERRLANEELARRSAATRPLAPMEAESLRARTWVAYTDSLRDVVSEVTRGISGMHMPELRGVRGAPDSATIATLAASAARAAGWRVRGDRGPGGGARGDVRADATSDGPIAPGGATGLPGASGAGSPTRLDGMIGQRGATSDGRPGMPPPPRFDFRTDRAIAKLGQMLPVPKPGVRRVLVLDLSDATGSAELRTTAPTVSAELRKRLAAQGSYEIVDASAVQDAMRLNLPPAALAAITHSGAVVTGTVVVDRRDSTVGAVLLVHDTERGYPSRVRTPTVAHGDATRVLGDTLETPLLQALDRVRWTPSQAPAAPATTGRP